MRQIRGRKTRVTATIPADLVGLADARARSAEMSRSAVFAEALRAHLVGSEAAAVPVPPGSRRVAEPAGLAYDAAPGVPPPPGSVVTVERLADAALIEELGRRLASRGTPAERVASRLRIDRDRLAELCRRRHIRRLALFGSVLREDFHSHSDVDVLVEFEKGKTPGLAVVDVQDELSALFGGQRVDVVTPMALHRLVRAEVLAEAFELYAA